MSTGEGSDATAPTYQSVVEGVYAAINELCPPEANKKSGLSTWLTRNAELVKQLDCGYRTFANDAKVSTTTQFRIASISKPITAAAILLLIENETLCLPRFRGPNRLQLSTRVFDLLSGTYPPVPRPSNDKVARLREITILDLLHHTSGWSQDQGNDMMFMDDEVLKVWKHYKEPEASLPVHIPQIVSVGWGLHDKQDGYHYSNFNYCLLGRVVEIITGTPHYATFVRKEMKFQGRPGTSLVPGVWRDETYYFEQTGEARKRSVLGGGGLVKQPYGWFRLENMDSHGGWVTTAQDLIGFVDRLFFDMTILNPTTVEMISAPENAVLIATRKDKTQVFYGLGWTFERISSGVKYWHNGSLPGTSTFVASIPGPRDENEQPTRLAYTALANIRNKDDPQAVVALLDVAMGSAVHAAVPGNYFRAALPGDEARRQNPPDDA